MPAHKTIGQKGGREERMVLVCVRRARGASEKDERVVLEHGEHSAISAESGGEAKLFAEGKGASGRDARVRRRKDETATGVERTGAEREGSGKVGRPGIDRLKKGWIFLPLGGGPAV